MRGSVSRIVVSHRDRLARIGFGLVEFIIEQSGCILTVIEDPAGDSERELAEDVMAVLTHFTAKHHGKRSYRGSKNTSPPIKESAGAV
jgi:predicted site-specific integrase-resolvase